MLFVAIPKLVLSFTPNADLLIMRYLRKNFVVKLFILLLEGFVPFLP
jgi:hypothetical protein